MRLPAPRLLVISDRRQASRPITEVAAATFAGGCRWFSLREKDLPPAERCALLASLVALGGSWGATVGVHEDIAAAIETGAGAVHLPSGTDPAAARARFPRGLLGASAHSAIDASTLLRAGADYVTVSPIFLTASKPGYGPALGLDGLKKVVAQAGGRVIALGGVAAENAALCVFTGAKGVAVMGEVMRAKSPRAAVEEILKAISTAQEKITG